MEPKRCPKCRLTNTATAIWCDCGHVFDVEAARSFGRDESSEGYDRPLHGILICSTCGLINPPRSLCCDCGYTFRHPPEGPEREPSLTEAIIVDCPACARRLRLQPPLGRREFKCPSCGSRFHAFNQAGKQPELQVLFDPSDLASYFELLGTTPSVSDKELQSAYRKRLHEYHPDKVASLGAELQELAEAKTKQINEAYTLIVEYRARKGVAPR